MTDAPPIPPASLRTLVSDLEPMALRLQSIAANLSVLSVAPMPIEPCALDVLYEAARALGSDLQDQFAYLSDAIKDAA